MKLKILISVLTGLSGLLTAMSAQAADPAAGADEITIYGSTRGLAKPIPIALSGFSGETSEVLRFDLEVGGFEVVSGEAAQYSASGSNSGQVQGELRDAVTKTALFNNRYSGGSLRSQAHHFADDIIEKITGKPGISRYKIAFKGESGGKSEIYIADFDGFGAVPVTKDGALVAAPCWMPSKRILYYTSYKAGFPDIYAHDLNTGERTAIARYPGLNTSAAVSRDGRVAMILSKSGSPDLYVSNTSGGGLLQITRTREDESSPCWSPDGRSLCYVSSANGIPALYVVNSEGGAPRRLRTGGGRATEPDWSPDGKWIAFTVQRGGFEICVIPAAGGDAVALTAGEDPSWAANSRTLIFSRSAKGKRILSLLDVPTKRVKDVAQNLGGCSQPSWAK